MLDACVFSGYLPLKDEYVPEEAFKKEVLLEEACSYNA